MNRIQATATAALLVLLPVTAQADDAVAPAANPMSMPAMTGPLAANPHPLTLDAGDFGKIYVTGALTGIGLWQNHHATGDHDSDGDITNGQVFVQKTDGLVQFFLQGGIYSIPVIGVPYLRADKTVDITYGPVPQGFIKLAPTNNFSIMAGKLPTLFGAEYTFTFENMNIERGLLWNQENAVEHGAQANYSTGPLAFSLQWGDGFYSNRYDWLSGSAAYTINSANTISLVAGGNLNHTSHVTSATPLAVNNGQIYNIIYTYNSGPWTVTPYLQYTHTPQDVSIGLPDSAATFGGAVLAKYSFDDHWSLAGRAEYIDSTGSKADGSPNLLYGVGSNAWSFTLTPAYQYNAFFGRAEVSYIEAGRTTTGSALGQAGNDKSQGRLLFEAGVLF